MDALSYLRSRFLPLSSQPQVQPLSPRVEKILSHIAQQEDSLVRVIGYLFLTNLVHIQFRPISLTPADKGEAYKRAIKSTSNNFSYDHLYRLALRFIQGGLSQCEDNREVAIQLFEKAHDIFNELSRIETSTRIAFGYLALASAQTKTNLEEVPKLLHQAYEQKEKFSQLFDCYHTPLILGHGARIAWQLGDKEGSREAAAQALSTLETLESAPPFLSEDLSSLAAKLLEDGSDGMAAGALSALATLENVPPFFYQELSFLIQDIDCPDITDKIKDKISSINISLSNDNRTKVENPGSFPSQLFTEIFRNHVAPSKVLFSDRQSWLKAVDKYSEIHFHLPYCDPYSRISALIFHTEQNPFIIEGTLQARMNDLIWSIQWDENEKTTNLDEDHEGWVMLPTTRS